MEEASLSNVKQEKTDTQPDLEEIRNRDQQLFSLISEGYEILNIRVPSKLPTVGEEESTESLVCSVHSLLRKLGKHPEIAKKVCFFA